MSETRDVVVVGGGAVGVCVALDVASRGASVELLERGPRLAWGCSAGNAGIVGPSHVAPLAGADALRDAVRWLGRPASPFAMAPRPSLLPWIARFLRASAPERVRRGLAVLQALADESARMHADLAARGMDTAYARRGMLDVYEGARAFATAARRAHGAARVLDGAAARRVVPALAREPAGAVFHPGEAHCDPGRFVEAVGSEAGRRGAIVRTGTEVLAVRAVDRSITSLTTTRGEVRARQVVVAAGSWTPRLLRELGPRLPILGGKGYNVDLPRARSDPELPVYFHERRVVVTPMPDRLRVAGTLELTADEVAVDRRRVDGILAAAGALRGFDARRAGTVWRGLRPCTPDGLPVVGRTSAADNLIVASGHGMWGLQLAPLTGRLVAQLACGERTEHDLEPLAPGRFSRATARPPRRARRGAAARAAARRAAPRATAPPR